MMSRPWPHSAPLKSLTIRTRDRKTGYLFELARTSYASIIAAFIDQRKKLRKIAGCSLPFIVALAAASATVIGEFLFARSTGVIYDINFLKVALPVLLGPLAVVAVARRRATTALNQMPKSLLADMVASYSLVVKPIDHRKEFEDEIRRNTKAQWALSLLGLPPYAWTKGQVAFRKQHLISLAEVGCAGVAGKDFVMSEVSAEQISSACKVLFDIADRHTFVVPR